MTKNRIDELVKKGMKNPAGFEKELAVLEKTAKTDPDKKKQILKEFRESLDNKGKEIKGIAVRRQLEDISDMISLSYLARHYFNKSRQWLNQRMNENIVNGKPAKFTPEQVNILNNALKDISHKIGSLNVVY